MPVKENTMATKEWKQNNKDKIRAASKRYYEKNKERLKKNSKEWRRNNPEKSKRGYLAKAPQRERNKEFVNNYKLGKVCIKCGFSDVRALVFHHRDPDTKTVHVSTAVMRGSSIEILKNEIAKCDLLCANCHLIHHWHASC
jgi:hypothetical protein